MKTIIALCLVLTGCTNLMPRLPDGTKFAIVGGNTCPEGTAPSMRHDGLCAATGYSPLAHYSTDVEAEESHEN